MWTPVRMCRNRQHCVEGGLFTGIGALGAIALGVLVNHDPITAGRLGALALIVSGVALARVISA
ncbi:MAG: hypothetical protein ACRDTX_05400 [Pseudonocardiaceae bacterium]